MKKLIELREKRSAKIAEMKTLHTKETLEAADEQRFSALESEVADIDKQIGREERMAAFEREAERGETVSGDREFNRELRNYSLASAINGALSGRLSGREAEIHQELSRGRETRAGNGIHLAVPSEIILGMEQRVGQTAGTYAGGGALIQDQVAVMADRFRPALKVEALGATVLRNLKGGLTLPNLASSGTASWVGENGNASRSAVTFAGVDMAPKTVTAEYGLSRRIMIQSGENMETILRRDLGLLLAQKLDLAAINGPGTTNQPKGILANAITKVMTEEDFSDTTANLIAELEMDDVTGTAAFLTNPTVMKSVRKVKDVDGHVIPVAELFHQGRVEVSSQVPANIGASSNSSALIYGQWGECYIGYWSSIDILLNPYHPDVASNGGALLHAFLDADVALRHLEAFAYAEI